LVIDTESQNTLLGHEQDEVEKRKNRVADVYRKAQEKKVSQIK
jgi:hypothetical protein